LAAQFAVIGSEIRDAIERVLASQQFILGREGARWKKRSRVFAVLRTVSA